ncbi:MAG: YceI family protein [Myxococcota bacterium]
MKLTNPEAECLVFTFKEGLLSKIAHDLRIRATELSVDIEEGSLKAEIDASSLRVETPLKDGVPFDGLSDKNKEEIQGNIRNDVLHADKHPKIHFESTELTDSRVAGNLTLHGVTRPVEGNITVEDGRRIVEIELHQPDYGIKPYTAMLGTLRVQANLKVRFSVPA